MSGLAWHMVVLGLIGRLVQRPAGMVDLLVAGLEPAVLPGQVFAGVKLVGIVDGALAIEIGLVAFLLGPQLWVFGHAANFLPL